MKISQLLLCFFLVAFVSQAQNFSRRDSLFGGNGPGRNWWDVQRYDVAVSPDYATKTISGRTSIQFLVTSDVANPLLQLDLQQPMAMDSLYVDGKYYISYPPKPLRREGDQYFIPMPRLAKGTLHKLHVVYHGKPKEAVKPPWDGGWIWSKDKQGRPWISVACEGDGASLWYPCKDSWSDEPDSGASLTIAVPQELTAVANGRLVNRRSENGKSVFSWEVTQPINPYNLIPYIGHYSSWTDTLQGEAGKLDLAYWVLDYEVEKARTQFSQAKQTLRAFEHWFGPYPFYEDGYKLVQSPHLGMEHQSAVAYGNEFRNGYLGTDLSRTGWGLKWDYIIVHESGHEWFGNNVTAKDRADMWVHEGFTDYSETLFLNYYYGLQAGNEYTQGLRAAIQNDQPIIAKYGVNKEGSGDMYFKGANLLHTIRQIINDDARFREILRGLNKDFYHQTVTSLQVEKYISEKTGKDFSRVFDQYLRTTKVPVLEVKGDACRWTNCIAGFDMPVRLANGHWISPTTAWKKLQADAVKGGLEVDKNFYIAVRKS